MIKSFTFTLLMFLFCFNLSAQKTTIALDFENRPNPKDWWVDNNKVSFLIDTVTKHQLNKKSKACLQIKWDSIAQNKPNTWFTDIKIDTFSTAGMGEKWSDFKKEVWLSFYCNTNKGDTLWIQVLLLTRDHNGKWGSKKMIPVKSSKWQFIKIRIDQLKYDNWGKAGDSPDFYKDDICQFELGLRNGSSGKDTYIDARIDNVKFTNFNPNK